MTVDEPRVRVTTNLAFGICLILLGTVLILDRLQLVAARHLLQFWPLGLVLFGTALVMQSFQRTGTAPLPRQHDLRLGPVIWLVIFGTIFWNGTRTGLNDVNVRTDSSDTASVVAVMSHHRQINSATSFRSSEMTAIMGHAELDLRNVVVARGSDAVIEVFTVMGGTTIRIPEGWTVDVRATPVIGRIRDRRAAPHDTAGAPRIVIRGFIMLGGLNIRS